jgi:hypothetical protein
MGFPGSQVFFFAIKKLIESPCVSRKNAVAVEGHSSTAQCKRLATASDTVVATLVETLRKHFGKISCLVTSVFPQRKPMRQSESLPGMKQHKESDHVRIFSASVRGEESGR